MTLRNEMQEDLREAFNDDLKDVVVKFELIKEPIIGEYDPETGEAPTTEQKFASRGIFDAMPTYKVNGTSILSTDEQLIIIADEIAQPPKVDNIILTEHGIEYKVVAPNPVLGGGSIPIIYEAQIRKNG